MSRGVQAWWLPIYDHFDDRGIHYPRDFDLYVVQRNITTIVESAMTMLVGLDGLSSPALSLGLDRIT
jgi:hypothetical protein